MNIINVFEQEIKLKFKDERMRKLGIKLVRATDKKEMASIIEEFMKED